MRRDGLATRLAHELDNFRLIGIIITIEIRIAVYHVIYA